MIIKLSFGDNALSHYLETFCVGLRDKISHTMMICLTYL